MELKNKLLVVIDIQQEYNTEGRPFQIKSIADSLAQAKRVLDFARKNSWPIVHVRHIQDGSIFNGNEVHSEYIAGFEPKTGEIEVEKSNFSCFSSSEFQKILATHQKDEIVVIGYNSTMCCLSTIIEGYHRGLKMTYVSDASAAKKTARFDEVSTHEYMTDVLKSFSTVTTADKVMG